MTDDELLPGLMAEADEVNDVSGDEDLPDGCPPSRKPDADPAEFGEDTAEGTPGASR